VVGLTDALHKPPEEEITKTVGVKQLKDDILTKTNGCANRGAPNKKDWIIDGPAQSSVYIPPINIITARAAHDS
jgi:hypothetical protein